MSSAVVAVFVFAPQEDSAAFIEIIHNTTQVYMY